MYVLAGLSVYALTVILFKIYQFRKARVFARDFIDKAIIEIRAGDLESANATLENAPGPVANIMRVSLACVANREVSQKSKEAEIARVGAADIRYLESHLRGLEMTANVSPLLGLLGTVIGMVAAFGKLSMGTRVDPSLLAAGIWEALIATVGGLVVAIPAMAAHYIIDGIVEKVRATMKDCAVQVLALEEEFKRAERDFKLKEERRREEERLRQQQEEKRKADAAIEEAKRALEEAKKVEVERIKEVEAKKATAQESSTLKLLSPRY